MRRICTQGRPENVCSCFVCRCRRLLLYEVHGLAAAARYLSGSSCGCVSEAPNGHHPAGSELHSSLSLFTSTTADSALSSPPQPVMLRIAIARSAGLEQGVRLGLRRQWQPAQSWSLVVRPCAQNIAEAVLTSPTERLRRRPTRRQDRLAWGSDWHCCWSPYTTYRGHCNAQSHSDQPLAQRTPQTSANAADSCRSQVECASPVYEHRKSASNGHWHC